LTYRRALFLFGAWSCMSLLASMAFAHMGDENSLWLWRDIMGFSIGPE
jgi:hypothetical protein